MAGACSLGLSTTVFPAARAPASGREQQLHRVVPRPDHQHHPERGQFGPGLAGWTASGTATGRGRSQALQVLLQVCGLGHDKADFGQQGFRGVLAQVAGQCFGKFRAALGQHPAQAAELLQPPGQRARGAAVVKFTGTGDGGGNGLHPVNVPARGRRAGAGTG